MVTKIGETVACAAIHMHFHLSDRQSVSVNVVVVSGCARTRFTSFHTGRNGIRFDLNSANRSIDFTAFKHPLAERQSLGVVPIRVYVCVRGLRVSTWPTFAGVRVHVDEDDGDRALLVADAVLIIMLIEISTAAKIDAAAALRISTLEFRMPRIVIGLVFSIPGDGA